ncbi:MAG: Fic family protein [Candidatus Micrarchaeota archaeon]|nr:Fic family protein [Candidatus Micrarchaeota archaeon]
MTTETQEALKILPNGVVIPTKEFIISIHDSIIEYRKELGKDDPKSIRDEGLIRHLCDTLTDRMHKYKENHLENALYVATETFYYIACQHPFTDANKSTAYVSALAIILVNKSIGSGLKISQNSIKINFQKDHWFVETPEEVKEIVKLAEGGEDEIKLKRFIKEFLQKQIGAKNDQK